jgi:hypothetical protein
MLDGVTSRLAKGFVNKLAMVDKLDQHVGTP